MMNQSWMKLRLFFCLVCFLGINWVHAQEADDGAAQALEAAFAKHRYTNKDSAYFYLKEMRKESLANEDYLDYIYLLVVGDTYTAGYFYDLENYKSALDEIDMMSKDHKESLELEEDWPEIQRKIDHAKGNYFFKLGQHKKSETNFLKLYEHYQINPPKTRTDINYYPAVLDFLGSINTIQNKLDAAKNYYELEIQFIEKNRDDIRSPDKYIADVKRLLSEVHFKAEEFEESRNLLTEALAFYESTSESEYSNAHIRAYQKLIQSETALGLVDEAARNMKILEARYREDDAFERDHGILEAENHLIVGEYEEAELSFQKSLEAYTVYRQNRRHQDIADIHLMRAIAFQKANAFDSGLDAVNQAIENLTAPSNESNDNAPVLNENLLFRAYAVKAQLQSLLGDKEESLQTSKSAMSILDQLRPQMESKLDKEFLSQRAYPFFEHAASNALSMEGDDGLEYAFLLSEKSKSTILLEAVRQTSAHEFAGIPDSIISRQDYWQTTISRLEKKVNQSNTEENQAVLVDSLAQMKTDYFQFIREFESSYPRYFDLKYKTELPDLKSIQGRLTNKQAVLHYMAQQDQLQLIYITKNDAQGVGIPWTSENDEEIVRYQQLLSRPSASSMDEIRSLGSSLFERLVPVDLADKTEQLVVIPDGSLYYLPFETLTSKGDFLIRRFDISYNPSVSWWMEVRDKKNRGRKNLLAFAPSFTNKSLSELPFNQDEVKSIAEYYGRNQLFIGEQATKLEFQKNAEKASIIHLATHAIVDDVYPDRSYLAFAGSGDQSELSIAEIYNTRLRSEMVALSACETAIGESLRGEGLVSLSRAFSYAGASSVLPSLWKVDDKSTATLMQRYYHHLRKGESKVRALNLARKDYLDRTEEDALDHPYYWAGFVLYGDEEKIGGTNSTLLLIGLSVILLAGLVIRRKRVKKVA